jgi:hypothetical protein
VHLSFQSLFKRAAQLLSWVVALISRICSGFLAERYGAPHTIASLGKNLTLCEDYDQWAAAATALDEATGRGRWRTDYSDGLVNVRVLEDSVSKIRQFRAQEATEDLLRLLQPCLSRNHCGINSEKLFRDKRPPLSGTKCVVEDFVGEVAGAISFVAGPNCRMAATRKLQWLIEARHSHGKTALLLSGGASFGLYHLGVVKALHRAGMLPKVLAGSSAGSIMAAMVATRASNEELEQLFDGSFSDATFSHAFDQKGSFRRKIVRFFKTGRLFDISKLADILRAQLGDVTFSEAYNKSGRVLNITVSPVSSCDRAMLLNHITAPDVLVWSACRCDDSVCCLVVRLVGCS